MSKKAILLMILLLMSMPAFAQSVDTAWVRIYKGPVDRVDLPRDIVVDASGNVYVTGASDGGQTYYDYTTIKYDAIGNNVWVRRYSGPGKGWDWAFAIDLDASGNVYVTGYILDSSGNDYATVKYDSLGNELWARRYNGPANRTDEASSMVVDSSGNIYVTGTSVGEGTDDDYVTIKYDPDGNELWVARYNGPDSGRDVASSVALDRSDNLYVTGSSGTIKYDGDGNELWHQSRSSSRITVDGSNNICVIVYTLRKREYTDYATIKYDSLGNELWVRKYDEAVEWKDGAFAIASDSAGNVYVTGEGDDDYVTVRYDSDGNELWVKKYDGTAKSEDRACDITVDVFGNVYVTGVSHGSGTRDDCVSIKYDSSGNQLWVARYDGPENGFDGAGGIVVDASGNVYVSGSANGSDAGYDHVTIKYVQTSDSPTDSGAR